MFIRRLIFSVAVAIALMVGFAFLVGERVRAQSGIIEVGMPQPACYTQQQVQELARLKNGGRTWAASVAAMNAGKVSPVCSLMVIKYQRGMSTSRVLVDNRAYEVGQIATIAALFEDGWRSTNVI
ncbi:MAG: hypothetical protein AAB919_01380, partial [Patescibacteria group bacterium]